VASYWAYVECIGDPFGQVEGLAKLPGHEKHLSEVFLLSSRHFNDPASVPPYSSEQLRDIRDGTELSTAIEL